MPNWSSRSSTPCRSFRRTRRHQRSRSVLRVRRGALYHRPAVEDRRGRIRQDNALDIALTAGLRPVPVLPGRGRLLTATPTAVSFGANIRVVPTCSWGALMVRSRTRSGPESRMLRPLVGLAAIALIAGIVWLATTLFRGGFARTAEVTVLSPRAGLVMKPGARAVPRRAGRHRP